MPSLSPSSSHVTTVQSSTLIPLLNVIDIAWHYVFGNPEFIELAHDLSKNGFHTAYYTRDPTATSTIVAFFFIHIKSILAKKIIHSLSLGQSPQIQCPKYSSIPYNIP